jgi:hypothetical protein
MTTASSAAGFDPAAPDREVDNEAVARFVERVCRLTEQAARMLGASEAHAAEIGEELLLTVKRLVVTVLPVLANANGEPGVLLTVTTNRLLGHHWGSSLVLQHSADLLASFDGALGSSPDGKWTLMRWLSLNTATPQTLAEQISLTRQLVDIVWDSVAG